MTCDETGESIDWRVEVCLLTGELMSFFSKITPHFRYFGLACTVAPSLFKKLLIKIGVA